MKNGGSFHSYVKLPEGKMMLAYMYHVSRFFQPSEKNPHVHIPHDF